MMWDNLSEAKQVLSGGLVGGNQWGGVVINMACIVILWKVMSS